jgi:hypothetical protein
MKTPYFRTTFFAFALATQSIFAGMVLQPGDRGVSSFEYEFALNGEYITDARVSAHEWSHRGVYAYSPWEYVEFGFGLGVASYSVGDEDSTYFDGDFRLSPQAHLSLSSPAVFKDHIRLRANLAGQRFSSEEGQVRYSANIWDPQVMLVLQGKAWQVEMGEQAHLVMGSMNAQGTRVRDDYSNYYLGRAFINLQYLDYSGWYVRGSVNSSTHPSGWQQGPTEMRIALGVGYQLRPTRNVKQASELDRYFPAVPKMRTQQSLLEKEMQEPQSQDSVEVSR